MTYQEKTKQKEIDLPEYDMSQFNINALNDRSPEPLTVDDVPQNTTYIRNNVMNLREYG